RRTRRYEMARSAEELVRDEEGLVEPVIFADEEIYRQEQTRVFARSWLFVGPEAAIPKNGDFLTTYMGEDAVIVVRDKNGRIRVFACWHEHVMPVQEHLGEMGFYLEYFLGAGFVGGLEVVPGVQKYLMPGNWKLCSDNFAGDHYHFPATHAAYLRMARELREKG